jgi:hypothetical protein
MMTIFADIICGEIGANRHGRGLPLFTEKLKVGIHIDNAT